MKMKETGFDNSKVWGMKFSPFYPFTFIPYYLFTFLLFALSGCVEEFEADLPADDADLLVVEGTIRSESVNSFTLSHAQPLNADFTPRIVLGAIVTVRGSDGSECWAHETYGTYSCQMGALNPDVAYYLHIETDGEVYESEPQKPLRTEQIAEVCGVQNTPESNINVLVTTAAPFEPDRTNYYLWTYDETWEVHSDYKTDIYLNPETLVPVFSPAHVSTFPDRGWIDDTSSDIMVGSSTNYEAQHIQRLKLYSIDRRDERILHRYSGLLHQRAVTKAEYEYELARRQAGAEMGGLFSPQPSSLPTNIRCLTSRKHVIGFVGCSMNTTDYRFFLNAADYTIYRPAQEDMRLWLENPTDSECRKLLDRGMYPCVWEDKRMMMGSLRTAWAHISQLDVRFKYSECYVEKPAFW